MNRWQLATAWIVMPAFVMLYPLMWVYFRAGGRHLAFRDVVRPWRWQPPL